MNVIRTAVAVAIGAVFSTAALAQAAAEWDLRDARQQDRILHGMQSGQITTREAAQLEHGAAHIDRMEARALADGRVTAEERARIERAQDRQGRAIYRESHNWQTGNPNSRSSQRMQHEIQHDIRQEGRVAHGVRSGDVTNREAGRFEHRQARVEHSQARVEHSQARVEHSQARAGADGRVSRGEAQSVQTAQNRTSGAIQRQRSDGQTRR